MFSFTVSVWNPQNVLAFSQASSICNEILSVMDGMEAVRTVVVRGGIIALRVQSDLKTLTLCIFLPIIWVTLDFREMLTNKNRRNAEDDNGCACIYVRKCDIVHITVKRAHIASPSYYFFRSILKQKGDEISTMPIAIYIKLQCMVLR